MSEPSEQTKRLAAMADLTMTQHLQREAALAASRKADALERIAAALESHELQQLILLGRDLLKGMAS